MFIALRQPPIGSIGSGLGRWVTWKLSRLGSVARGLFMCLRTWGTLALCLHTPAITPWRGLAANLALSFLGPTSVLGQPRQRLLPTHTCRRGVRQITWPSRCISRPPCPAKHRAEAHVTSCAASPASTDATTIRQLMVMGGREDNGGATAVRNHTAFRGWRQQPS